MQTGLITNAHSDLVTHASYDFYGLRLATCSLDQRIKIWQLDESTSAWSVEDDWKAHDAAVSRLSWAHPEFGSIVASASFDRTVKIWEQSSRGRQEPTSQPVNGNGVAAVSPSSRWIERAVLLQARGTVRAVEFAPHHFGLKLASISTDNQLRIYECLEQPSLATWQLTDEIDVSILPTGPSPSSPTAVSVAFTPTQTSAAAGPTLEGASASLVAQALMQQQGAGLGTSAGSGRRPGSGNREADGGWCISWCKDRYWGEVIAVSCGIGGLVKIIHLSSSRRPTALLTLDPSPAPSSPSAPASVPHARPAATHLTSSNPPVVTNAATPSDLLTPTPHANAITTVAWAPSCGRSYHLIATGSRDGHVRIWRVRPGDDGVDGGGVGAFEDSEDGEGERGEVTGREEDRDVDVDGEEKWSAYIVADFDDHKSQITSVEWNITGTVLSSAGNDGRIRLWKATVGRVWRAAGSIGVEAADGEGKGEGNENTIQGDAEMD